MAVIAYQGHEEITMLSSIFDVTFTVGKLYNR